MLYSSHVRLKATAEESSIMQPTTSVYTSLCKYVCYVKVQKNISPSPPLNVHYGLKRQRAPRVIECVRITLYM